ncbi:MAG: ribonuclease HII [Chlamydiales bacterium]
MPLNLQSPLWRQLPKSEQKRLLTLVEYERVAQKEGHPIVAGVDEAGRGPLAGPVVAAAVIVPSGFFFPGIDDSKKLTPRSREALFTDIQEETIFGLGIASVALIEKINILQATLQAMRDAIQQLGQPAYLLVDGTVLPSTPGRAVIKGDALSQSIACASILAKVTRDRMMSAYEEMYPDYGFAQHKGYGTAQHRAAIQRFGLCPLHRPSFCTKIL